MSLPPDLCPFCFFYFWGICAHASILKSNGILQLALFNFVALPLTTIPLRAPNTIKSAVKRQLCPCRSPLPTFPSALSFYPCFDIKHLTTILTF
jgi:hypothetical protein